MVSRPLPVGGSSAGVAGVSPPVPFAITVAPFGYAHQRAANPSNFRGLYTQSFVWGIHPTWGAAYTSARLCWVGEQRSVWHRAAQEAVAQAALAREIFHATGPVVAGGPDVVASWHGPQWLLAPQVQLIQAWWLPVLHMGDHLHLTLATVQGTREDQW